MDLESAKAAALAHLAIDTDAPNREVAIIDEYTKETAFSWIFFWDSKKWVEGRDPKHRLLGNVPILVDKASGVVRRIPWGGTIEQRIAKAEHYFKQKREGHQ